MMEVSRPSSPPRSSERPASPCTRDPPPEYTEHGGQRIELPAQQGGSFPGMRAELSTHRENRQSGRAELPANQENSNGGRAIFIDYEEQPPPVGPKPPLSHFIQRFRSLLD
ncbi:hypothetical protein PG985_006708 [Apiospora marii]|uniref:Uncharacterized protein n=1 Tax=Apiospora marii TaxID=335849 RepID=A0ABR1S8J9_9PEZI